MEKKLSPTRVKAISLVLMIILVAAFSLLVDFISAEFSTTLFTDVTYWANTFSVQLAVIVLIFVSRSLAKERERGTNPVFRELQEAIRQAYITINSDNLNGAFKRYIEADNRERKLKVYRARLSAKAVRYSDRIKHCELLKGKAQVRAEARGRAPKGLPYRLMLLRLSRAENKLAFWNGKLERAENEVDFVRVRFVKFSYSILFNDAREREREEDDPAMHEGRSVAAIFFTKAVGIFAFGIIATSYIAFDIAFSWGMVLKALIKLLQIVIAIYTGTVAGQDFVRQTMCAKLTIRCNYVKQFMEKQRRAGALEGAASAAVIPSEPV